MFCRQYHHHQLSLSFLLCFLHRTIFFGQGERFSPFVAALSFDHFLHPELLLVGETFTPLDTLARRRRGLTRVFKLIRRPFCSAYVSDTSARLREKLSPINIWAERTQLKLHQTWFVKHASFVSKIRRFIPIILSRLATKIFFSI